MVVSAWCFHVGFNFTAYCLSYFIYTSKHPFLERYRIMDQPWPWESDPEGWKKTFRMTGAYFFVNQCIITPSLLYIDIKMNGVFVSMSPDNFPSSLTIILQCFFCMLIDDFFFYWGHRLLHHPKLYPHIHKIHHRWNHTVIISNEFSHPFEYIIANLPAAVGPKLLGKNMHMITLWMWIVMRVGESLDSHCGYEFSWSPYRLLPLSGSSQYHDFHHSNNVGNYGSYFTFWDTLFKTNEVYFTHIAKREREAAISQIRENYSMVKQKVSEDLDKKHD
jgi:methylsterol monooxygenase/4-alpha-methyl-delta7-sterol-4alpha-methyl oxidase